MNQRALAALHLVKPYVKEINAFNTLVRNAAAGHMNYNTMLHRINLANNLKLTRQQWYALAGVIMIIHRYPNVNVVNKIKPIANKIRSGRNYSNNDRKVLLAWARKH